MFSILNTQHPFIKHIHSLIDHYGIDQYGAIRGTTYTFSYVSAYYNRGYLYDNGHEVLLYDHSGYTGSQDLFIRAEKLIKEARQRIADEAIQERINSDIEKYLTSTSPLPEAMEDLKKMNYHKNEIIKLSKKWQDAITNLHT